MGWLLSSEDLESALSKFFKDLDMPTRLRDFDIPEADLEKIAFETSKDVPNLSGNPIPLRRSDILKVLKEYY